MMFRPPLKETQIPATQASCLSRMAGFQPAMKTTHPVHQRFLRFQDKPSPRGNAALPVVIIFAALALSAAIFFLFTRKKLEQKAVTAASIAVETAAPPPAIPPVPEPAPAPPPPPKPAAPGFGFARPMDLGEQLARSLAADPKEAGMLVAAGDPKQLAAATATLEKLKSLGYVPAAPDQVQILGQSGNSVSLALPLMKNDGSETTLRLLIDVVKDPKMGWKISALRLPSELQQALVAMEPGSTASPPLITVQNGNDALTFASDFVRHLLKPDYDAARKLVDEQRVSGIKLAALCIVFEDGQYTLNRSRPLVSTVATETTNWVIAKIQSESRKEETEFGLEMEKLSGGWRITGLNLSKLLEDNARSSAQDGIPYTPLVQNPKGGESIALYFEYDSDVIHPRAKRQLEIVAKILKASPSRNLKIGGYTDALGTDDYNLNLSRKRAEAVKATMIDIGVPIEQVQTVGFGAANPLSPNVNPDGSDNPDGRSKNRRAEILLDF